jgi:hypothetical protein
MRLPRKIIEKYFPNDNLEAKPRRRIYNKVPLPFSEQKVKFTFSDGVATGYQVHPRMYGRDSINVLKPNPNTRNPANPRPRARGTRKEKHRVRENPRLNDGFELEKYWTEVLRSFPDKTVPQDLDDPECTESLQFAERLHKYTEQGHISNPTGRKYFLLNDSVVGYQWTGEDIDSTDYCCIIRQIMEPSIPKFLVVRTDVYFKLIGINAIITDFTLHPKGYTVPRSCAVVSGHNPHHETF